MIEIRCDEKWENLINKSELQKILTIFLKYLYAGERGISLYIANDAVIQKLNREFRGKDCPTDILSWAYDGDDPGMFEAQMSEAELENSERAVAGNWFFLENVSVSRLLKMDGILRRNLSACWRMAVLTWQDGITNDLRRKKVKCWNWKLSY